MKTLTEFAAATLKNALKTQADLVSAGKPPEELPAAMGEALKLEGDKLGMLVSAIGLIQGKKAQDLKRVVVLQLNEGEKAPAGAQQVGGHYYAVEFYSPMQPAAREDRRGRESKGRDGKRRGKGRGDRGGERGGRGPRPEAAASGPAGMPSGEANSSSERKEGKGRPPRGERKTPREPQAPRRPPRDDKPAGPPTIKLKDGTVFMPRTSGVEMPKPKKEEAAAQEVAQAASADAPASTGPAPEGSST